MKNKNKGSIIAIALIILGAIILGGAGYVYKDELFSRKPDSDDLKLEEKNKDKNQQDETKDWKIYKNEEMGIEFKYPSDWGNLSVRKESSEEDALSYKGTKISAFNETPKNIFSFEAYTSDFIFLGMDDSGGIEYKGRQQDKQRLNCSYYEINKDCKNFEIQGRKAISVYTVVSAAGGVHFTKRTVLIENAHEKFSGIILENLLVGFSLTSVNSVLANEEYLKDIKNKINKGEFTMEDKKNMEIFNKIISTFKFNN